MTTPHCPHCNAQGLKHLAFEPLAAFALVYCKECGAIYGAVPCPQSADEQPEKTHLTANPSASEFPVRPASVARAATPLAWLGNADLSIKQPLSPQKMEAEMRMARMYALDGRYIRMVCDDEPPFCLTHKVEMREMVIPDGYLNAGRRLWVCPEFGDCQTWATMDDD